MSMLMLIITQLTSGLHFVPWNDDNLFKKRITFTCAQVSQLTSLTFYMFTI